MKYLFLVASVLLFLNTSAQLITEKRADVVFNFHTKFSPSIYFKVKTIDSFSYQPLLLSKSKSDSVQNCISFSDSIYYPAFFCKMENKINTKLNVRIKVRAGNDDLYQRLLQNNQE